MNPHLDKIKKYWEEQAAKHKGNSLATSPDTIAFEMEIDQMKKYIPTGSKVLDVGCGNGLKGVELAQELEIEYWGLDYSEEMIRQAIEIQELNKGKLKGSLKYILGDILNKESLPQDTFDVIISDRCLINLQTMDNIITGIHNIHSLLKEQGTYLMFENSYQALNNLNEVRRIFSLPEIQVRWHNIYIDEEKLFPTIKDYFFHVETIPFASTYYLISRTLNALLTPIGEEINYMSELNQLSAKLPSVGDYSPIKLFILKKLQ